MSYGGSSDILLALLPTDSGSSDPDQTLGRLAILAMALLLLVVGSVITALIVFSLRRSAARAAEWRERRSAGSASDAWTEAGRRANPPEDDEAGPDDDTVDVDPR